MESKSPKTGRNSTAKKAFLKTFLGLVEQIPIFGKLTRQLFESRVARRKKVLAALLIMLTVVGVIIWPYKTIIVTNAYHLIPSKRFSPSVAGILVLRITGDDNSDSLQRTLIGSIHSELANDATGQRMVVLGADDSVDERQGLEEAHKKARAIGEKRNALLVIWGSTAGEARFFPRITIVRETNGMTFSGERTLMPQEIHEYRLTEETVAKPIYLAHFVDGYSYCIQKQYAEALNHFQAAMRSTQATPEEAADLRFLAGWCHLNLAQGQKSLPRDLQAAIDDFVSATNYYGKGTNLEKLAITQNNLGLAYANLTTGNQENNLEQALAAFQAALQVFTDTDLPLYRAMTQNNLGTGTCWFVHG